MRTVLACLLAAASVVSAGAALARLPAPVTLNGVGGATPGMSVARVRAAWGIPLRFGIGTPGSSCRTAPVRAGGLRGYALFEHGRFGAVFFRSGASTPSGVRIGSTETVLRRAYAGRLVMEPHKYVPGGKYFFLIRAQKPRWQIRFDTNARGRITQIAFGGRAAGYVEGCS